MEEKKEGDEGIEIEGGKEFETKESYALPRELWRLYGMVAKVKRKSSWVRRMVVGGELITLTERSEQEGWVHTAFFKEVDI